jgi:4-hydroxybenzoate polyprenyltransferase
LVLAFLTALAVTVVFSGYVAAAFLLLFPISVALYGTPLIGELTSNRLGITRFKDLPYIKAFYVAFFWGVLALFAAVFLGVAALATTLFFFAFVSSRLFINTVFCDLKDLGRDATDGVMSLPLALGIRRTLLVLHGVNVATLVMLLTAVLTGIVPFFLLPIALVGFYTYAILQRTTRSDADVEFLGIVSMDAEFILWLPLTALGVLLTYSLS